MKTKITRRGYLLPKSELSKEELVNLKKELTIKPNYPNKDKNEMKLVPSITNYLEEEDKIIVPAQYGLDNWGEASRGKGISDIKMLSDEAKSFKGSLLTHQKEAYQTIKNHMEEKHRGIFCAATGSGKTFLALKLVADLGVKTLIISASVNQIDLLNQWRERITQFLPKATVGLIQGKKVETECDIILATISSLSLKQFSAEVFSGIGLVIIDECHHISSATHSQSLFKFGGIKHVLGLSATPERPDGLTKILKWWVGDIFFTLKKAGEGLAPQVLTYSLQSGEYQNEYLWNGKICFTKMISHLIRISSRNRLLIDTIISLADKGREILLVSERIEHVQILEAMLQKRKVNFTYSVYIGTKMKEAEKEQAMKCQVILATSQSFGEGIDKSTLDTLLLATPKKYTAEKKEKGIYASISFVQIIGRIFRQKHIKHHPLVVDFLDDFSVFATQGYTRKKYYRDLLQPISTKKVDINLDSYQIWKEEWVDLGKKSALNRMLDLYEPKSSSVEISLEKCLLD